MRNCCFVWSDLHASVLFLLYHFFDYEVEQQALTLLWIHVKEIVQKRYFLLTHSVQTDQHWHSNVGILGLLRNNILEIALVYWISAWLRGGRTLDAACQAWASQVCKQHSLFNRNNLVAGTAAAKLDSHPKLKGQFDYSMLYHWARHLTHSCSLWA